MLSGDAEGRCRCCGRSRQSAAWERADRADWKSRATPV